ncbi:MAG: hypothetical protein R2780_03425 [Crocinitomicaceae bacterium]|nr:hypothetical protein [Crocinitomicaceae bacterium]
MNYKLLLSLFVVFFLFSCLKDKTLEPKPDLTSGLCSTIVSYSLDIRPIIESSCKTQAGPGTGCHDAWIDNYSPIENYISIGSWQNRCFSLKDMPEIPNAWAIDSLSEDEIQTMKCWIEQGYPEN